MEEDNHYAIVVFPQFGFRKVIKFPLSTTIQEIYDYLLTHVKLPNQLKLYLGFIGNRYIGGLLPLDLTLGQMEAKGLGAIFARFNSLNDPGVQAELKGSLWGENFQNDLGLVILEDMNLDGTLSTPTTIEEEKKSSIGGTEIEGEPKDSEGVLIKNVEICSQSRKLAELGASFEEKLGLLSPNMTKPPTLNTQSFGENKEEKKKMIPMSEMYQRLQQLEAEYPLMYKESVTEETLGEFFIQEEEWKDAIQELNRSIEDSEFMENETEFERLMGELEKLHLHSLELTVQARKLKESKK